MNTLDQKGTFYLGREYDLETGAITDRPLLYKARHLTTHGVILGMTGSGKTGLGVILLEEALLQGLPTLIVDPKGDITNLLLTFPELRAEDFAPWVDPEGARRRGISVDEYAVREAEKWKKGLAQWDITGERIARLRQAAQFTVFTPGSKAGQPINVLNFLDTPQADWDTHEEELRERVGGIVSALLGLVGVAADPLQSPEHILLARIIEHMWRAGQQLSLPTLIQLLQNPPFQQVGVFELETFFSQKDRFNLARSVNNLIAAPGFEVWQEGTPLSLEALLYATDGRPRASVFYLAHLNDAQRIFFITLLLEAARDWMRVQSGTTDLRMLLYFDEVFGYFPPYPVNPPTKTPLLALVKQGRAAGLGVVMSTQNPADLDYKGLTNAGTWVVGALRADRDKARVLEGLEGAVAEAGDALDRQSLDRALGALKPRVFLFHDIREGKPVFFHTRWAMSYLRGPLTRKQLRELGPFAPQTDLPAASERVEPAPAPPVAAAGPTPAVAAPVPAPVEQRAPEPSTPGLSSTPPTLPLDVHQVFLPPTVTIEWALRNHEEQSGQSVLARDRRVVYAPHLLGIGRVRMLDRKRDVDHLETVARLVQPGERSTLVDWDRGQANVGEDELSANPAGEGSYTTVPSTLARAPTIKGWEKDFSDYLYHNISTTILYNPTLELYGRVGESRRDFRVRCEEEARKKRDAEVEKARASMDKVIARVQDKLRREKRELASDEADLGAHRREELLSIGESALNLFTGRRSSSMITRASRKRRMTQGAKADVAESQEVIEDLEEQLETLGEEWQEKVEDITARWADTLENLDTEEVGPRRTDVMIQFCGLAWVPSWQVTLENGQTLNLPARQAPEAAADPELEAS